MDIKIIDKKIKQAKEKGDIKLVEILKKRRKQLVNDETVLK